MKNLVFALFCCISIYATAQTKPISGLVLEKGTNNPIVGVNVTIVGTMIGVTTNIDGKFQLQIPPTAKQLQFSFIGMEKQIIEIGDQKYFKILMKPDTKEVDEVVVTALGIKREAKALGYSTSTVKSDEISRSGETNVIQALAGKTSGIQVIGSSGVPGASSKILIRGNSSFTGNNNPLIVVDGVPINNRTKQTKAGDYPYNKNLSGVNASNRAVDLNPEDIESVSILKGPAAAALYGVRAANGAIIYTTKKAKAGKMKLTYGYKLNLTKVSELPDFQHTYAQGENGTWDPIYNKKFYDSWGPKISDVEGLKAHNNVDDFFETGVTHQHDFSIFGGVEKASFRLSYHHTDQEGMVPNTFLEKNSVRITGEMKMNKNLTVGGTANYIKTNDNKGQQGSNVAGLMLSLFRAPTSFDLYDKKNGGYMNPDGTQRKYVDYFDNPYWSAYNNTFEEEIDRVIGNIYGIYKYKKFALNYKLGVDQYTDKRNAVIAIGSNGGDAGDGLGEISKNIIINREIYSNFFINYTDKIKDVVGLSVSVGHNINEQFYENAFLRGRKLGADNFPVLSNASDLYSHSFEETVRTAAYFGILDLDYKNMLYLNATGRNEWASTLGTSVNDFFYPAINGSFVFTELFENDILSFGKLRVGWAKAGNNPEPYNTRTYYARSIVGSGMTGGLGMPYMGQTGFNKYQVLGNEELKPETTKGIEAGLDLRLYKGRINLDLTLYKQTTSDILVSRPIASTSGYRYKWVNSGEMENKGIELAVNLKPIKNQNFEWDIDWNFTKNKSNVNKLATNVKEINLEGAFYAIGSYAIVGEAYGSLYSAKWERDDQGRMIIDKNGFPERADERGKVGDPFPKWTMNIRNSLSYKNLMLSWLFDIREGGDLWAGTYARLTRHGRTAITADREGTIVVPGVTKDGKQNTVAISKKEYYQHVVGDFGPAENAVYNGSWIRLRDVTLSYRYKLPQKSLIKKYINAVNLSVTGRNLWLDTDYPGVDPETSLTGARSNLNGFDYFNMPGSKSYIFSLNVEF